MNTYRIGEIGKRFGLSRSTLLYYDRIGLLRPDCRSQSRYRIYGDADMDRLDRIRIYRESGLSLSEIARLLDGDEPRPVLEGRLREIGREIAELKTRQRHLAGMLRTAKSGQETSGLDRTLWLELQKACGLSEEALRRWHGEFERRAPSDHHAFLSGLGLSEKEALQVRMLTRSVEENETTMRYFYDVFEDLPRQGPGSSRSTLRALSLVRGLPPRPEVLDIGCGSGAQTLVLARHLRTRVVAIDNHLPVLERLSRSARSEGLEVEAQELSMFDLPFEPESFDLLWAEGSIFVVGLEQGLRRFRDLARPGACFAFSEMCWFRDDPPEEIRSFFERTYPDLRREDEVRRLATDCGWTHVDDFRLPASDWRDGYYEPMLERIRILRERDAAIPAALDLYANLELEARMFEKHSVGYGYSFFVLRRPQDGHVA